MEGLKNQDHLCDDKQTAYFQDVLKNEGLFYVYFE